MKRVSTQSASSKNLKSKPQHRSTGYFGMENLERRELMSVTSTTLELATGGYTNDLLVWVRSSRGFPVDRVIAGGTFDIRIDNEQMRVNHIVYNTGIND